MTAHRPLSPHLQIYRWQMSNTLSILHRLTGIILSLGSLVLCFWLVSIGEGPSAYHAAWRVLASPIGILALIGWTAAFFYHLLNGVRHLFWDIGRGFEATQRRTSGWLVVWGSVFLTLCIWAMIWHLKVT